MASNDIKQKIVLEGEKQYRDAIKDAQRTLKTLRSELKAETAEMGANATAQQKNEAKVKSLKKQIAEQEKIVKANRDALAEVKEKYGENADAVAKYEQKLNESRTALANMKNELDSVGGAMKTVQGDANLATIATNSVADSLGRIGDVAQGISDSIEGIFTGMVAVVKEAVTKVWAEVVDIAARANNWSDTAAYLGSTASDVQMWSRAISGAQGDFNNLVAAITKLKYGGKDDLIRSYFNFSGENYTDDLKYITDLFSIMAESKDEMEKAGTWDKAMKDLFGGKKAEDVMWFINNWGTVLGKLDTFDAENGGFGLTGEELEEMNQLYVLIGETQQKWQALKDSITTKLFAGVVFDITTNANNILDAFNEYFNAETQGERDAALGKIKENILAVFTRIQEAINEGIAIIDSIAEELKSSDDPTAQALGSIMGGIADALQWFTEDHMRNVVKALEILAAFWIFGNGVKMASAISSVIANIATIKTFSGGALANSLLNGAAGAGAQVLSQSAVTSAITAAGGPIANAIAGALTSTAGIIGVGIMMMAPVVAKLFEQKSEEQEKFEEAADKLVESTPLGDKIEAAKDPKVFRRAVTALFTGTAPVEETGQKSTTKTTDERVEELWDLYRKGNLGAKEWEFYKSSLGQRLGGEDAFMELAGAISQYIKDTPGWKEIEDLPAVFYSEYWKNTQNGGNSGNTDGLTSGDARGMTDAVNRMPAAVQRGMSNIRVVMDGNIVGRLVASEVSRQIAAYIV